MIDKHITRLVKNESGGTFETLHDVADAIKLAGRGGAFDLEAEFGVSADRCASLDRVTQLAIAVGLDALRDAGIPLVLRYKTTTKGTQLPDRWGLPDIMRDDTGVIFGSAFPGYDSFAEIMSSYFADHARREQVATLDSLRSHITGTNGHSALVQEIEDRLEALRAEIETKPYVFDRRFLTQGPLHGTFAVCRADRGSRSQHPNQFRLRDYGPSGGAGAGLDPHGTVPPRDRYLGRRRYQRPHAGVVRRGLPSQRGGSH